MFLDNIDNIKQFDRQDALGVVGQSVQHLAFKPRLNNWYKSDQPINKVVIAGMGGSCLAGLMLKNWLDCQYELSIPLEITRDYVIPSYVDQQTLVICFSVSGNTEEILSSLYDAESRQAQIVTISSGGQLEVLAKEKNLPYLILDKISQPRYGIPMHLRVLTYLLSKYQIISEQPYQELAQLIPSVESFKNQLITSVDTDQNLAKKIAEKSAGKTVLVFSSRLFYPLAYKWKTSFNENAKNILWCNEFPEFNHNEFIGWTSHPIEKPFAIFNLRSNLDNPRINERFDLTEKLLSGHRPTANNIILSGDSYIEQLICGAILGDFASIYLGILNGVNPTPVDLVEKFKKELS